MSGSSGGRPSRPEIADHDGPRADLPAFDQAIDDIGVLLGEGFRDSAVGGKEDEQGAVGGISERAREDEFAAGVGFASEMEMLFAEGCTAGNEVIGGLVEKRVVGHLNSSQMCL